MKALQCIKTAGELGGSRRIPKESPPENPWGIRGDLFGYVAGLMSTIGCLEGHNVKLVEVAAMREVCRVRRWEIPSEFSLNPLTLQLF
jgi:hypothetical protein